MKIAINNCYGGFGLPDDVRDQISSDYSPYSKEMRVDPKLISLIEERGGIIETGFSGVVVSSVTIVEIPDEATDWMIDEYDGAEAVIYVLDGKLHRKGEDY